MSTKDILVSVVAVIPPLIVALELSNALDKDGKSNAPHIPEAKVQTASEKEIAVMKERERSFEEAVEKQREKWQDRESKSSNSAGAPSGFGR